MTLNEAIKHAIEVADHYDELIKTDNHGSVFNGSDENCVKCANEHRQLAEWLTELKERRGAEDDAIDLLYQIKEELREELRKADLLIESVISDIKELPSAQPKNIYCKDCKYSKSFDDGGIWCDRLTGTFKVESGGYCKWGKA